MNQPLLFTPLTPLEQALCARDEAGALALLEATDPARRQGLLPRLAAMERVLKDAIMGAYQPAARRDPRVLQPWGEPIHFGHRQVLAAARFACGGFGGEFEISLGDDTLLALARRFRPPGLEAAAPALPPQRALLQQQLYQHGLARAPTGENFVLGLMHLPARSGTRINASNRDTYDWRADLDALLAEDPGLAGRLLRIFDLEGNADFSLANSDKYHSHPGRTWADKLLDLCAQGVFTREQLLDKVLHALSHDWPQYRSGWHSRFHAALAPSADEMRPFAQRYLALCHSRIPPTVALALDALKPLAAAQAVAGDALMAALVPVMNAGVKAQVAAALKLLDGVVRDQPARAAAAAVLACRALQLNDAATQGQVLQRLRRWPLDDAARAALAELRPHVSAQHQAAVDALLGAPAPADAPPPPLPPPPASTGAAIQQATDPLDPSRRLPDITDRDELIEACARLLAGDEDVDLFEQVLHALVRQAPLAGDALRAFGPVLKQARKAKTPLAQAAARLITHIAGGPPPESTPPPHHDGAAQKTEDRLHARISALIELATQGLGLSPLSCATHRRGAIDPATLVQRAAALAEMGVIAPAADQGDALLRLIPTADPAVRAAADALPPSGFARALRYALGCAVGPPAEPALAIAAARIRHVDGDDDALLASLGDVGPDGPRAARFQWSVDWMPYEVDGKSYPYYRLRIGAGTVPRDTPAHWWPIAIHLPTGLDDAHCTWAVGGWSPDLVAYFATLQPSSLQSFFAEGVRLLGNHLQWTEVAKHLRAYLPPLLDPTVTLGPMGHLLLAVALGEREPTRAALAVDALLATHAQQRLQWSAIAPPLQQLLWQRVVTPPRLLASLQSAAQRDAAARHTVFELLCALCATPPDGPAPKGFAKLLSLLLDLALALRQPLPTDTRDGLARLQAGGSGEAPRRRLLALSA